MTRLRLPAALLVAALAAPLGACSSDDDEPSPDPSAAPSATPSEAPVSTPAAPETAKTTAASEEPESTVLDIEVAGDEVSPNAAGVDLGRGEPLLLRITSDRAGELHVHSRPEQYVEFGPGTTEHELVVDTPGSVEVEEHDSGAVVAVLQVGG